MGILPTTKNTDNKKMELYKRTEKFYYGILKHKDDFVKLAKCFKEYADSLKIFTIDSIKVKSESRPYLEEIRENLIFVSTYIIDIENIDKSKTIERRIDIIENFLYACNDLSEAFQKASKAKFSKFTFGAVLDHRPTKVLFVKLAQELFYSTKEIKEIKMVDNLKEGMKEYN